MDSNKLPFYENTTLAYYRATRQIAPVTPDDTTVTTYALAYGAQAGRLVNYERVWWRYVRGVWHVEDRRWVVDEVLAYIQREGIPEVSRRRAFQIVDTLAVYAKVPDGTWPVYDGDRINFQNGCYNAKSGILEVHDPRHGFLDIQPGTFVPGAQAPAWEALLDTWFPPDAIGPILAGEFRRSLQIFMGSCFAVSDRGCRRHSLLITDPLPGHPSAGCLQRVCQTILGDHVTAACWLSDYGRILTTLDHTLVFAMGGDNQALFQNHEYRSDTLPRIIKGQTLTLHSHRGEVIPRARYAFVYRGFPRIPRRPRLRGWVCELAEHIVPVYLWPPATDAGKIWKDRIESNPDELSGILSWCLEGLQMYRQGERGPHYRDFLTGIEPFIRERCALDPTLTVRRTELYGAYEQWASGRPAVALVPPLRYREFCRCLEETHIGMHRVQRARVGHARTEMFAGISLRG